MRMRQTSNTIGNFKQNEYQLQLVYNIRITYIYIYMFVYTWAHNNRQTLVTPLNRILVWAKYDNVYLMIHMVHNRCLNGLKL